MFYTIYKITNLVNGKTYIGKHQTLDLNDGYMGSGKLITNAIKKYGLENFKKDILHLCKDEEEMNRLEKELVIINESTYNLCPGGQGGFGFINRNGLSVNNITKANASPLGKRAVKKKKELWQTDPEWAAQYSKSLSQASLSSFESRPGTFTGKRHNDAVLARLAARMKESQKGSGNNFHKMQWIKHVNSRLYAAVPKEDVEYWIKDGWEVGKLQKNATCVKLKRPS